MKRTQKETSAAISKAIKEINTVITAQLLCTKYKFFDTKEFKSKGFNRLVKDVCRNNNVKEAHIRKIAGWENMYNY